MAIYTNKNGTDSNDTLTYNSSSTVIYHANKGNDTIKITGGKVTVYTDAGTNTITATGGSGHVINVAADAAASDKITSTEKLTIDGANAVSAILGSGKDTVELKNTDGKLNGALAQIRGGAWGDTFVTNNGAKNYQLYGDAGDDIFTIKGGNNLVFWGGAANDTFDVTGGTNIKLRGGDSADIYNIKTAKVDMQLGYGNDVVNVEAGDNQQIKANLGINTINLKAGKGHVIVSDIDQAASKKVGHDVGYGVDKVYITGTASEVTANLGDGKDVVEVSSGSGHKIYTEGWGDSITVSGAVSDSLIDAGAGDDTITVAGGSKLQVNGGDGSDAITISGGKDLVAAGNEGNDKIIVSGGTGITISGDAGNDSYDIDWQNASAIVIDNRTAAAADADKLNIQGTQVDSFNYALVNDTLTLTDVHSGEILTVLGWNKDNFVQVGFDGAVLSGAETEANTKILRIAKEASYEVAAYEKVRLVDQMEKATLNGAAASLTLEYTALQGQNYGVGYELEKSGNVIVKFYDLEAENKPLITEVTITGAGAGKTSVGVPWQNSMVYVDLSTIKPGNSIWDVNNGKYLAQSTDLGGNNGTPDNPFVYNAGEGENTITGQDNSHVEINGGAGGNTIKLDGGSDNTINGGTGSDNITINGGANSIANGGAGDDTITVTDGTGNTIDGGAGDDTITVTNGAGNKIEGGAGNDNINLNGGSNNTVNGTEGENTITVSGGENNTINGGKDNDTITATDANNSEINGGAGNDTITVTNGTGNTIDGGAGNDSIIINSGSDINVQGGDGADNITINGGTGITVDAGIGNDTITVAGGTNVLIKGGADADHIIITGGSDVTVAGGAGDDTYTIDWSQASDVTIDNTSADNADADKLILNNTEGSSFTYNYDKDSDTLTITDGNKTVTILAAGEHGLEEIQIGGETTSTAAIIEALDKEKKELHISTSGNYTLKATTESLVFSGADWNAVINGSNDIVKLLDFSAYVDGTYSFEYKSSATTGLMELNLVKIDEDNAKTIIGTVVMDMASGADTINVLLNNGIKTTIAYTAANDVVYYSAADDLEELTVSNTIATVVSGNAGSDSITLVNSNNVIVEGGSGYDNLIVKNGSNIILKGGADEDIFTVYSGSAITMDGGAGDDIYIVDWAHTQNVTVNTTDGKDRLTILNAKYEDFVPTYDGANKTLVLTDKADNTITINRINNLAMITFDDQLVEYRTVSSSSNHTSMTSDADKLVYLVYNTSAASPALDGASKLTVSSVNSEKTIFDFTGFGPDFYVKTSYYNGSDNLTVYYLAEGTSGMTMYKYNVAITGAGKPFTYRGYDRTTNSYALYTVHRGTNSQYVYDSITFDEGTNSLNWHKDSKVENIYGLGGNDDITISNGTAANVYGGEGNDTLKVIEDGNANKLWGGAGDDTLTVAGGNNVVLAGNEGNDSYNIDWSKAGNVTIDNTDAAAADMDKLVVTNIGSQPLNYAYDAENDILTIDNGAKTITILGATAHSLAEIKLGDTVTTIEEIFNEIELRSKELHISESKTYVLTPSVEKLIFTGEGWKANVTGSNDIVKLLDFSAYTAGNYSYEYTTDAVTGLLTLQLVNLAANNDKTIVGSVTLDMANGANAIKVQLNDSLPSTINYASEANLGYYSDANDVLNFTSTNSKPTNIFTNGGNDNITLSGSNITLDAGDGADEVTVNEGINNTINSGTGSDTIVIKGGSGNIVNANGGDDIININSGSNLTVYGDSGNDTYNVVWGNLFGATIDNTTANDDAKDVLNIKNASSSDFNYKLIEDTMIITDINTGDSLTILGWNTDKMDEFTFIDGTFSGEELEGFTQLLRIAADGSYDVSGINKVIIGGYVNEVTLNGTDSEINIELANLSGANYGIGYENNAQGNVIVKIYDLSTEDQTVVATINLEGQASTSAAFVVPGTLGLTTITIDSINPYGIWDINAGKYLGGSTDLGGNSGTEDDPFIFNAGDGENEITAKDNEHIEINGGSSTDKVDADNVTDGTINTGAGDDQVNVNGGTDVKVDGGAGDDTINLEGGSGNTATGGAGNDTINMNGGSGNTINGTEGENTITVTGGENNTVNGGTGVDTITVTDATNSEINGGAGNDKITVDNGTGNTIEGGAGDDTINLNGGSGNTINGTEGENTITVTGGENNTVNGGTGVDTITATDATNSEINGGAGNDNITIDNGTGNTIEGGAGNDTINLNGGSGNTVNGTEGENTITITGGENNTVNGGTGVDTIVAIDANNSEINGGAGDDYIAVDSGTGNTIVGGEGNDTINLNGGSDNTVNGGTGADMITATDAKDTEINGGVGNDIINLNGGSGNTINGTEGENTITVTGGENNTVNGGTDADTIIATDAKDTEINGGAGADNISVDNGTGNTVTGGAGNDTINLNGGSGNTINGTEGENTITVTGGENNTVNSGTGSDTITATDAKDTEINGGAGNDNITVDNGTGNTVVGGAGNDTINVNGGSGNTVNGTEGENTITVTGGENNTVNGGTGADTITATDAKDTEINGGEGNDTINLNGGSGNTVNGTEGENTITVTGGENNTVNGGTGADTITATDSTNTEINGGAGNDNITVDNGTGNTVVGGAGNDTINLNGGSGNTINGTEGENTITVTGGENNTVNGGTGNDTITATNSTNTEIDGGEGNDTINVTGGSNVTVDGGAGNDNITVDNGTGNTITSGAGNDTINVNGGSGNTINGTEGENTITVTGGENNTINGGTGADTITATDAKDTEINGGAGNDTINVTGGSNVTVDGGEGADTITLTNTDNSFVSGGAGNDIITLKNSNSNTIDATEGKDVININSGRYNVINLGDDGGHIETINGIWNTINGGSGVDEITIAGATEATVNAGAGNDIITIDSGEGNIIFAGEGDDTINIKPGGDEIIHGGAGNDTINVNWSKGGDFTIDNTDAAAGDLDTLILNVSQGWVDFAYDDATDTLTISKEGLPLDTITIKGAAEHSFSEIKFTDGTTSTAEILDILSGKGKELVISASGNYVIDDKTEKIVFSGRNWNATISGSNTLDKIFDLSAYNGGMFVYEYASKVEAGTVTLKLYNIAGGYKSLHGTVTFDLANMASSNKVLINNSLEAFAAPSDTDILYYSSTNDTETINGAELSQGKPVAIIGNGGNDSFTLNDIKQAEIGLGAGDDTLQINGIEGSSIDTGAGADTLTIDWSKKVDLQVNAKNGMDVIQLQNVNSDQLTYSYITNSNYVQLTLTDGSNSLTINNIKRDEAQKVIFEDKSVVYSTLSTFPNGNTKAIKGYSVEADQYVVLVPKVYVYGVTSKYNPYGVMSNIGGYTVTKAQVQNTIFDFSEFGADNELQLQYYDNNVYLEMSPYINNGTYYNYYPIRLTNMGTGKFTYRAYSNAGATYALYERHYDTSSSKYEIDSMSFDESNNEINWTTTVGTKQLFTNGGDDVINIKAGTEIDMLDSGSGDDSINITSGLVREILAGEGNDTITIESSVTRVDAGVGNDTIYVDLKKSGSFTIDNTTAGADDVDKLIIKNVNEADLQYAYDAATDVITMTLENQYAAASVLTILGFSEHSLSQIQFNDVTTSSEELLWQIANPDVIDWNKITNLSLEANKIRDTLTLLNLNSDEVCYKATYVDENVYDVVITDNAKSLTVKNLDVSKTQLLTFADATVACVVAPPVKTKNDLPCFEVEADKYVGIVPNESYPESSTAYTRINAYNNFGGYKIPADKVENTVLDFSSFGNETSFKYSYDTGNVYVGMNYYKNSDTGRYKNFVTFKLTNIQSKGYSYRVYDAKTDCVALNQCHYDTKAAKFIFDSITLDKADNVVNWDTTLFYDKLYTLEGNDTININSAVGIVDGGTGDDTYVVDLKKSGSLTIDNSTAGAEDKDKLVLKGYEKSDLELSFDVDSNALLIRDKSDSSTTPKVLKVLGFREKGFEEIIFDDVTLSSEKLLESMPKLPEHTEEGYVIDWQQPGSIAIEGFSGSEPIRITNANYEDFTCKFDYVLDGTTVVSTSLVLTDKDNNTFTINDVPAKTRIIFDDKSVDYIKIISGSQQYTINQTSTADAVEYLLGSTYLSNPMGFYTYYESNAIYNLSAMSGVRPGVNTSGITNLYCYVKGSTSNSALYVRNSNKQLVHFRDKDALYTTYLSGTVISIESIQYGPQSEVIKLTKAAKAVYAQGGDDVITVTAKVDKVYVGSGNDTVTPDFTKISTLDVDFTGAEAGDVNTVVLANYAANACKYVYNPSNNSMAVTVGGKSLTLSNLHSLENNYLTFKDGSLNMKEILNTCDSLDVIVYIDESARYSTYNGNDKGERIIIENLARQSVTLNCGAGNDFVENKYYDPKAMMPIASFGHTINLGEGDDIYLGNCGITEDGLVSGGAGNDTFVLNDWYNIIDAGAGDDVIYVGNSVKKEVSYVIYYDHDACNYLTGGAGNDTFIVAWGEAPGTELIDEDEATVKLVGVDFNNMKAVWNTSTDTVRISTAADNFIDLKTWSAGGYKQISFLDEAAGKCYSFDSVALSQISTAEVSFGSLTCNTSDLSEVDQEQLKTLKLAGTNLY